MRSVRLFYTDVDFVEVDDGFYMPEELVVFLVKNNIPIMCGITVAVAIWDGIVGWVQGVRVKLKETEATDVYAITQAYRIDEEVALELVAMVNMLKVKSSDDN